MRRSKYLDSKIGKVKHATGTRHSTAGVFLADPATLVQSAQHRACRGLLLACCERHILPHTCDAIAVCIPCIHTSHRHLCTMRLPVWTVTLGHTYYVLTVHMPCARKPRTTRTNPAQTRINTHQHGPPAVRGMARSIVYSIVWMK
jgi:hypothetical protein